MKYRILLVIAATFCYSFLAGAENYFPENAFHDFKMNWYSKHLTAMAEPSIYEQRSNVEKEIYRFTWLRTFHHPISVRIEIIDQNNAKIFVKETDGAGGYETGKIKVDEIKNMSGDSLSLFKRSLNSNNFWSLPKTKKNFGLDGAQWILEGLCNGKYHLVERWSPESGNVREIGLLFLELTNLTLNKIY